MHAMQLYTADGCAPLLQFSHSGVVVGGDVLDAIQTDLAREYYNSLTSAVPDPQEFEGEGSLTLVWIGNAEPTILGLTASDVDIEPHSTALQYTNATMAESVGKTLLQQCSEDGGLAIHVLQALWLNLLRKYLNLEQPSCRYVDASLPSKNRNPLCTVPIGDDDGRERGASHANREKTMQYDPYAGAITPQLQPASADATLSLIYTGTDLRVQLQTTPAIEHWLAKSIIGIFTQSLEFILGHPSCRIRDIPVYSADDISMILTPIILDETSLNHQETSSPDSTGTGDPKGCAIDHQAFCTSAVLYGPQFRMAPPAVASCNSLRTLRRFPDRGARRPHRGSLHLHPAMLTPSLVARLDIGAATGRLVLVGEAVTAHVRDAWAERVCLLGGYGPSEATPISAVVGPLAKTSHPTNIGRLVANRCWVVEASDHDRLVPVGAIGERLLEGYTLGRGYIGDEERTSRVFIADPAWTTPATYLAMRCADGSLQFIRRKDMQTKLQGQRIELGDIETHLRAVIPAELAVEVIVPHGHGEEERTLVAFLCLEPESTVSDDLSSVDAAAQARLHDLVGDVEE
ncbi:hypothetical protein GGR50DRAFT_698110 [Xylaria sp. CBS 124048]|nr:hypothetical protein GGR50DRAFT_698110 [Xylaria sp. CBS 124048]